MNGQTIFEQVGTNKPTVGAGFPDIGWKKLASYNWNTNTNYIDFDGVDLTKYIHYKVFWYISHGDEANSANTSDNVWFITALRFKTTSGLLEANNYDNNTLWTTDTGGQYNADTDKANIQEFAWLAGNGGDYDSQGEAIISMPNYSGGFPCIRGNSHLMYRPTTESNYRESFSSVYTIGGSSQSVTGFRIYGTGGSNVASTNYTHSSKYGSVQIMGLEI